MMLLADSGIYIMESANLEPLGDARVGVALLVVTPLKIEGATGSPLRVLAIA
jgi:kynurenine formamidase